jgi:hypothetical protein
MKIRIKNNFLLRVLSLISILGLLLILSLLFSCEKYDPIKDSPYYNQGIEVDSSQFDDWHDNYSEGGVLDNDVDGGENPLINTKWVLTQYRVGFGPIQYPNDTLNFNSINQYTINNGGAHSYTLSILPMTTNYELTLNYFWPFGGSHYSTQVGGNFVDDWTINNASFIDLQGSSDEIQAYFIRIQ